jgi:hypothetical protein
VTHCGTAIYARRLYGCGTAWEQQFAIYTPTDLRYRTRSTTLSMTPHTMVRIKPAKPPSGSRVTLNALDRALDAWVPLNLFFRPSSSGPNDLQSFAASLQDVLDRLPMIAGSIYDTEDAQGVKSKELVDDGRGAELIWVDSPIAYADLPESPQVSPRTFLGSNEYSEDQPLLMAKFIKVCSSISVLPGNLSLDNSYDQFRCDHWPRVSAYRMCLLTAHRTSI